MFKRFRDQRIDENTRQKYRETFLDAADFIMPLFIVPGNEQYRQIDGLPDVYYYSVDMLVERLTPLIEHGLRSVLLFPVPHDKYIERAYAADGLVQCAARELKDSFPQLEVISDVCLCAYTADGHCHMMDGRVWFIKRALQRAGFMHTKIMSYAAKYASNFYGPFRTASGCALDGGDDRKTYQMDYCNVRQAMREIEADVSEGADAIIVKPALAYLDVVSKTKALTKLPVVAYNVSGEYLTLKNAIARGILARDAINESLIAMKRAGADRIISYFVEEVIRSKR